MSWVIAIPSFKRSVQIREKTLKVLKSYDIPPTKIFIFVASDEEAVIYAKENPAYRIIVGERGLPQQRNFIMDYFEIGMQIISLDDDIECIYQLISKREQTMERLPDFAQFTDQVFSQLKESKLQLAGIYP